MSVENRTDDFDVRERKLVNDRRERFLVTHLLKLLNMVLLLFFVSNYHIL